MKLEPGMAYNTKKLNIIFAVLSVIFLFVTIWMALDDYIRPWKAVQVKSLEIKRQVIAKQLKELEKEIKPEEVEKLNKQIEEATAKVKSNTAKMKQLENDLASVKTDIYAQKLLNGDYNAQVGELTFKYEHEEEHGNKVVAERLLHKLNENKHLYAEGKEKLKQFEAKEKSVIKQIYEAQKDKVDFEKNLTNYTSKKTRLEVAFSQSKIDPVWILRNAPFGDYLDPTIKINQVVVANGADDRYFQKVPKVDRCMTCHVFIDQAGYEDQKNPYKTHPKMDSLAVGVNSSHPMKDFGCTVCHGGEGHRVNDFNSVAHTPENEKQKQDWIKKYNWHEPHKIPQPMYKLSQTESSCFKCHDSQFYIPKADHFNKGRQLVKEYGCYNCHKIKGFEGLPKSGPLLTKINSKISKEFALNWIWSPRLFNPKSRMPTFFTQSNNSTPEFMAKNITEVNAMVEYLFKNSKDYSPSMKFTGGNVEKGKELVATIGCTGCHQVEGIDNSLKTGTKFGPYLTGLGSKLDPNWLITWIKKPTHYNPNARMPSLRLTDGEANDITAFLLNSKNEKFKNLNFTSLNKETRDELLLGYLSAFDLRSVAEEKLKKMSDEEKTIELGFRSIGKYGCYSCHEIAGFDPDRAPIGPDLSGEGSKPVEQFGFGHEKIDHKRDVWLANHLERPSRWDVGVPKTFNDLNRMPNFYLSKEEIESMVVAILGQVNDYVPMNGKKILSGASGLAEKNFNVISKYNCQGCHKIDGVGGDILASFDDKNDGPPQLNGEGHRVQSDWLNYFLRNVHPIRPWVKVRMPTYSFTSSERNAVVTYFQNKSNQPNYDDSAEDVVWESGEKEAASALFKELACASCHTTGFSKDAPTAPDLHNVKKRMRASWIEKWLENPQSIIDTTPMPAFWADGANPAPTILGGDAVKQRKALVKYLLELGNNNYPAPFNKNN